MTETRSFVTIMHDVKIARENKVKLDWTSEELAFDMLIIARQLIVDIEKYLNGQHEAPAKRIRRDTKILETLGKSFRVESVRICT